MMTKLRLLIDKYLEGLTACGLAMVQGDVTALSLYHFIVASKVGLLTGIAYVIVSFFSKLENKLFPIFLTGILVTVADWMTHPSHFAYEAIITGAMAMAIATVWEKLTHR